MKLKAHSLLLVLLAAALPTLATAAEDPKKAAGGGQKTLATVNGAKIPQYRADAMLAEQKTQPGTTDTEDLRKQVKEELVRREILAQEAKKKGLDKKQDIVGQIELARDAVLIRAYLQDYMATHKVSDDDVKKEFDKIVAALGKKEYKARHVLVEKEDEAKGVIEKLKKGDKIEDLAKAQSKDPGSKDKGGDLGWAPPSNYVKPFGDALVALEKGKYTETPVKSDFGYHVIQLDDVRDIKLPAYDEAKPGLEQRIQQQAVQNHIVELRKKAKVE
jgi:peptidyl-prolyl cis-trans isomerase C